MQFDLDVVEGRRTGVAQTFEFLFFQIPLVLPQTVFGERLRIGIDDDHADGAVDN